ncbi:hypothetical protein NL676_023551 [Syzygium grande]|nr:hypothetical protein NL676_023551 [Syzygium grande]
MLLPSPMTNRVAATFSAGPAVVAAQSVDLATPPRIKSPIATTLLSILTEIGGCLLWDSGFLDYRVVEF